jgi:hypothetical protein
MGDQIIDDAIARLREHLAGELRFDEHVRQVKYIISPPGRIVSPAMVAMVESIDTVLYVPAYQDDAMELQVTLSPLDERGPDGGLTDRWRAYHGEPEDVRWAWIDIDAARFRGHLIDGEALARPNPLAADEPALCKWMNSEHAADLGRLCAMFAQADVEKPVMVGIDPSGFDVRRRFDVVHVRATEPMPTGTEARRVLEAMMAA